MAPQTPRRCRQPRGSRRTSVQLHAPASRTMEERAYHQRDRAAARGVQATHQDTNRAAFCRNRRNVVLGFACLRPDQYAQSRRLENARRKTHHSDNRPRRLKRYLQILGACATTIPTTFLTLPPRNNDMSICRDASALREYKNQ